MVTEGKCPAPVQIRARVATLLLLPAESEAWAGRLDGRSCHLFISAQLQGAGARKLGAVCPAPTLGPERKAVDTGPGGGRAAASGPCRVSSLCPSGECYRCPSLGEAGVLTFVLDKRVQIDP